MARKPGWRLALGLAPVAGVLITLTVALWPGEPHPPAPEPESRPGPSAAVAEAPQPPKAPAQAGYRSRPDLPDNPPDPTIDPDIAVEVLSVAKPVPNSWYSVVTALIRNDGPHALPAIRLKPLLYGRDRAAGGWESVLCPWLTVAVVPRGQWIEVQFPIPGEPTDGLAVIPCQAIAARGAWQDVEIVGGRDRVRESAAGRKDGPLVFRVEVRNRGSEELHGCRAVVDVFRADGRHAEAVVVAEDGRLPAGDRRTLECRAESATPADLAGGWIAVRAIGRAAEPPPLTHGAAPGVGYRSRPDLPVPPDDDALPEVDVEVTGREDPAPDGVVVYGPVRNRGPYALAAIKLAPHLFAPEAPRRFERLPTPQTTVRLLPVGEWVGFRLTLTDWPTDGGVAIVPRRGDREPGEWVGVTVSDGNNGLEIAPSAAGDGTLEVQGTVTNNSGKDLQEFRVVVEFYDGDNRFLEAVSKEWTWDGVGPKLVAGGSMAFTAATVRTRERDVIGTGRIVVRGIGKIGG